MRFENDHWEEEERFLERQLRTLVTVDNEKEVAAIDVSVPRRDPERSVGVVR